MQWDIVIGLEIHVQLATKTKIFSGSSTTFGAEPNTQASAVDLAMPGTLPVPNEQAFRYAVMFGLAVNAEIARRSVFERKNYFYPDLPKGYQTTQLERPIVGPGHVFDIHMPGPDNRAFQLRGLIAFGQVRIKVILALEHGSTGDFGVHRQAEHYGIAKRLFVGYRQSARHC